MAAKPSETLAAIAAELANIAKTLPDGIHWDRIKKAQAMAEKASAEQVVIEDKAAAAAKKAAAAAGKKAGA